MNIEELNKISKRASQAKSIANSEVSLYDKYVDAEKLYKEAYEQCLKSTEISEIQKKFLSTIYLYESLDCQYAYSLKKKEFQKCQELSVQKIQLINLIINKYSKDDLSDDNTKRIYTLLADHKKTSEFQRYFPIGKSYFEDGNYKEALFYFRRAEEVYETRKKEELPEDFLNSHFLNYYIIKFNISQSQVGILHTDIEERDFLERQTIKQLLESIKLASEVKNISSDNTYKQGFEIINSLIKNILIDSKNSWQTLFDYTHSEHLLKLMIQIDLKMSNTINTGNLGKTDSLLFYTHGFNTRGAWKDSLTEIITSIQRSKNVNFILLPWDYGTFKTKFFLKKSRKKAVASFIKRYNEILDTYGYCERKCLIAHSFGTYITGTAIQENESFIFDKIVLAGNILDINYDWEKLKNRNQIGEVLIEQSTNDRAVLFAKIFRIVCFQKWIGYAGRNGFCKDYNFITVLKSNSGHSGMLNKENMKNNWFSFLIN